MPRARTCPDGGANPPPGAAGSAQPGELDNLPESTGGVIKELMEYDFMDPEAQRMFQELLDTLRSQMAQNFSQDLTQHLQNVTPEDMAALREMLRQLNQMLQDKAMGREPDFDNFHAAVWPHVRPPTRPRTWNSSWSS